jgi:hypothetical protein
MRLMQPMARPSHLRDDREKVDNSVSPLELFFDLVFVFAVTQLSHYLLAHHTLAGALQDAGDVPRGLVGVDSTPHGQRTGSIPAGRRSDWCCCW